MSPYPTTDMEQVVTAIAVSNTGATSVSWQARYLNGNYTRVANQSLPGTFSLPTEMINLSRGKTVIAAEATVTYAPVFSIMISPAVPLYRSNFYLPRFGGTIALRN
jgi:hypothetical protein